MSKPIECKHQVGWMGINVHLHCFSEKNIKFNFTGPNAKKLKITVICSNIDCGAVRYLWISDVKANYGPIQKGLRAKHTGFRYWKIFREEKNKKVLSDRC